MYLQATLKKRKMTNYPLKIGAGAGADDMNEEGIVYEVEPPASWLLSKRWSTAMSKLVAEMAYLCSIYDADFRNMVKNTSLVWGRIYVGQ